MIDYERLRLEALAHPKKRSRVILVPGFDMVICLHRDSYVRMHRHPQYEAYHVLQGSLIVMGEESVSVYDADNAIVCIPPGMWHEPLAQSEFVIYREFYCGPFDKARDVEYCPTALSEAA